MTTLAGAEAVHEARDRDEIRQLWAIRSAGVAAGVAGRWAWHLIREHGRQVKTDPYRIAGIATRSEVAASASEAALLRRAKHLRPSLDKPRPEDVGYRLGISRGKSVWASVEDSIILSRAVIRRGAHVTRAVVEEAAVLQSGRHGGEDIVVLGDPPPPRLGAR